MYDLDEHVAAIKDCYRKRRDVMMATMEREFPEEAKFTHPNGGLFTWDGRNQSGKRVSSGVYNIISTNAEGKKAIVNRVTFIH